MAEPKAFAKLWWKDHNPFYIQKFHISFGRSSHNDIIIEEDKKISRIHAEIYWNENSEKFILKCLSKNGLIVNSKLLMLDQEFTLFSKCPILIGNNKFYFLLSTRPEEASALTFSGSLADVNSVTMPLLECN